MEAGGLDVEEQVPRAGGRQALEPPGLLEWKPLDPVLAGLAALHLNPGLGMEPLEALSAAAGRPIRQRGRRLTKLGQRRDPLPVQLRRVQGAHPRHKGEMIVLPPTLVAVMPPAADIALGHRQRVGTGIRLAGCHGLQLALDVPEVRGHLGRPEGLPLEAFTGLHDMHELRLGPLQLGHGLGVHAQLEDRPSPGLQGQLGVDHLVPEVAEVARPGHLDEEVREAREQPVRERRLEDDVGASLHELEDPAFGRLAPDLDHGAPLRPQVSRKGLLVGDAPLLQHLEDEVRPDGRLEAPLRGRAIELREVRAAEMLREVRGREPELSLLNSHRGRSVEVGVERRRIPELKLASRWPGEGLRSASGSCPS